LFHNFITKTDQLGVLKIMLMSNFNYPVFNEQFSPVFRYSYRHSHF